MSVAIKNCGRYLVNIFQGNESDIQLKDALFWKLKILETILHINDNVPPIPRNANGDIYVGTPGIAYMFFHLSKSPLMLDKKNDLLKTAIEYIESANEYFEKQKARSSTDYSGFILGKSGFYAIASVLYDAVGNINKSEEYIQKFVSCAQYCSQKFEVPFGGDELFVGRSGYLAGVLWLESVLNKCILTRNQISEICSCIYINGCTEARKWGGASPLMYHYHNERYIGAAHGLSSILQVLLSFDWFLNSSAVIEDNVKQSVDYILSIQAPDGNFPCTADDATDTRQHNHYELVHWCHGAPGVVYMMAKAFLRWKEEKYLNSCIKAADLVWKKGILTKGPGICHGVAGNGYVFLMMYRLTNDIKYLNRAAAFGEIIYNPVFKRECRTPDSPYSLYEGLAGTVCFLADLQNPSQSSFPFSNIFYSPSGFE